MAVYLIITERPITAMSVLMATRPQVTVEYREIPNILDYIDGVEANNDGTRILVIPEDQVTEITWSLEKQVGQLGRR